MMRKDESGEVVRLFREKLGLEVSNVDATECCLGRLKGVFEPEKKRKIIGNTFIEVFEEEAKKIKNATHLFRGVISGRDRIRFCKGGVCNNQDASHVGGLLRR
jgi:GMP synthase (glutamine-hydrolysing)